MQPLADSLGADEGRESKVADVKSTTRSFFVQSPAKTPLGVRRGIKQRQT